MISSTGSGKSLCFQLPPLLNKCVAVVISPLISLMRDQCESLNKKGVHAEYLGSGQSDQEAESRAFSGRCSIIYCCPETLSSRLGPKLLRLRNTLFSQQEQRIIKMEDDNIIPRKQHQRRPPPMILAVDECHCVSHWGNDFRKEYLKIGRMRKEFLPNVPCVALTATATPRVREDVCSLLKLSTELSVSIESFDRPNLHYSVHHCPMAKKNNMEIVVKKILKVMRPDIIRQRRAVVLEQGNIETVGPSAIVYCTTRKDCELLAAALNIELKKACGWREGARAVEPYHAGLPQKQREETQRRWTSGSTIAVCATIAFGMGIDKSNVRLVLHYGWPQSLESYHQESGRAGRDGLPAKVILFAPMHTLPTLLPSPGRSAAVTRNLKLLLRCMHDYGIVNNDTATHLCCRRRTILKYFSDQNLDNYQANGRPCCDLCDRRSFLSQQRKVVVPLMTREHRHHHNVNSIYTNNASILPTKREPILNQTLHLLKFLVSNGADKLESGIALNACSLKTLVTSKTAIAPSSSWKWWRGLCRMLVREEWLERGTITTNYMTKVTAAGKNGRRRKKRFKKRTTKRKRNDGVATVSREATRNTEVVFVTSLGKELHFATQKEVRSISTPPSASAKNTRSKILMAINTKMSCYHDLDMVQLIIDHPSSSCDTTNTNTSGACATSSFTATRANGIETQTQSNWANRDWRMKEIARRKQGNKYIT